jgi:hypothetical protein
MRDCLREARRGLPAHGALQLRPPVAGPNLGTYGVEPRWLRMARVARNLTLGRSVCLWLRISEHRQDQLLGPAVHSAWEQMDVNIQWRAEIVAARQKGLDQNSAASEEKDSGN